MMQNVVKKFPESFLISSLSGILSKIKFAAAYILQIFYAQAIHIIAKKVAIIY